MVHHTTYSPNTINRRLMAIKAFVKASAQIERFDPSDALKFRSVELVRLISMRHRLKPHARVRLEPDDVRRLCTLPDPTTMMGLRDRVLLNVLATSGCRIAEVMNMDRFDVVKKGDHYFVEVVGKGKTEPRLAPLSRQAQAWIERWLGVRDEHVRATPLFTAIESSSHKPLGHRISADTARLRIKRYAEQAGLAHVKPHDFRRFVATQIAEKYGIRQAQLALGHSSPEMTARYYVMDELAGGLSDGLF
jgi:integrase